MGTFTKVGVIAGDWVKAIRGARDNPLAGYWHQAEARRLSSLHWFRRSPGLISLAAVLSLTVTFIIAVLINRNASGTHPFTANLYARSNLETGTFVLLHALLVFALCWLAARLFIALRLALGFLELRPGQLFRESLDDMLAVTRLSPAEVLIALGRRCLEYVLPPLLLLTAVVLAYQANAVHISGSTALPGHLDLPVAPTVLQLVMQFSISAAKLLIGGLLASLTLVFLYTALGLHPRSGGLPQFGAGLQVIMQLLLIIGGLYLLDDTYRYDTGPAGNELFLTALQLNICLVLLLGLLLYLARRLGWLRRVLGYGLPLVLFATGMVIYGNFVLSGISMASRDPITAEAVASLQNLGVFNLAWLLPDPRLFGLIPDDFEQLAEPWRWPLELCTQVALLLIMAEFARDAIRRRIWGEEGA